MIFSCRLERERDRDTETKTETGRQIQRQIQRRSRVESFLCIGRILVLFAIARVPWISLIMILKAPEDCLIWGIIHTPKDPSNTKILDPLIELFIQLNKNGLEKHLKTSWTLVDPIKTKALLIQCLSSLL